jgi:hypothetical protein
VRGKEAACKNEIVRIFDDYAHEFYGPELQRYLENLKAEEENAPPVEEKQLFIEDLVAQEIAKLKDANQTYKTREEKKKEFFSGYEIGCECGRTENKVVRTMRYNANFNTSYLHPDKKAD